MSARLASRTLKMIRGLTGEVDKPFIALYIPVDLDDASVLGVGGFILHRMAYYPMSQNSHQCYHQSYWKSDMAARTHKLDSRQSSCPLLQQFAPIRWSDQS